MRKFKNFVEFDKGDLIAITFIIFCLGILLGIFISCQTKKSYEYLDCPCKIIDKKETPRGYQVTMINSDSVTVRILDKELKEKKKGEIIE